MVLINRRIPKIAAVFAAVALCIALPVAALTVPSYTARVMDEAGVLSSSEKSEITSYLESLEDTTGIQIAVLTIPSLENEDLESYSIKVAQTWKLGDREKDNGALLLIAYAEHKVRIETGYGLEEKLTDAKCGLIIRNVITPKFRSGKYGEGIIEGVKNMGGIASDNAQLVAKSVATGTSGESDNDSLAALFFGLVFFIVWLMVIPGLTRRRHGWLPWLLLPLFRGSSHDYNHHDTFGGFGGGFGGGGSHFSGGGGGSFGGGGASGGW
jgi:uncharacterized protein